MNKVIIAIVAVVVLAGAGVAGFLLMKDDDKNDASQTGDNGQDQAEGEGTASVKTTAKDLLASNKNQQCIFSGTVDGGQNQGTIYVSNKRMHMDYSNTNAGKVTNGSVILLPGTQYFWDADTKQGAKLAISEAEIEKSQNENIEIDQEYEFRCSDWNVDDNLFTPPADVTFQDLTALQTPAQ